jgi:hypothetical protein
MKKASIVAGLGVAAVGYSALALVSCRQPDTIWALTIGFNILSLGAAVFCGAATVTSLDQNGIDRDTGKCLDKALEP